MKFRAGKPQRGFTLVELAIVLVIIGLIVGGVLAGKEMIRAAQVRSLMAQITMFSTSISAFELKYDDSLPGDMTNATAYWGTAADCSELGAAGIGTLTCNGNGDRAIDPGTREMYLFWQHLSIAKMIPGGYTGAYGPGGAAWEDVPSINVPNSRITGYSISAFNDGAYSDPSTWSPFLYKNSLYMSVAGSFINPPFTTAEASSIDIKYDNGQPGSGSIITFAGTAGLAPNCVTTNNPDTAAYNLSATGLQCFLIFGRGFQ